MATRVVVSLGIGRASALSGLSRASSTPTMPTTRFNPLTTS